MFDFFKRNKKIENQENPEKPDASAPIFEEALVLLRQMQEGKYKDWCRRDVAVFLGASGQQQKATELIQEMQDPIQHDLAYIGIAVELAKQGEYEDALKMSERIKDKFDRSSIYHPIAKMQAEKREYSNCLKSIETANVIAANSTDQTAVECALIAFKNGNKEFAKRVLEAGTDSPTSLWKNIAEALLLLYDGKENAADKKILELNTALGWKLYAEHLTLLNKWEQAEKTVEKIEDTTSRELAWQKLAAAKGKIGDKDGALTYLKNIRNATIQAESMRVVAIATAENNHLDMALQIVEVIGEKYRNEQSIALSVIMKTLIDKGAINEANTLIKRVPYPHLNTVLEAFAAHCVKTKLHEQAREFIDKVKDNSHAEMNLYVKAKALAYLGNICNKEIKRIVE